MKINSLIILLFLFFLSCTPGKIFEKHIKMGNLAWNRFNTVTFDVNIKDTGPAYDIYIAIRHITDMPYPEIDVYFYFTTPGGETRSRKITIPVKDKDGNNLGDGLGELWDLQYLAWEEFKFDKPGICEFEVSSAMSQMDLIGILEVGLIVKKSR
jgi:gliding motility-associated lipoprotein GldH